jgi:hypothetical protein
MLHLERMEGAAAIYSNGMEVLAMVNRHKYPAKRSKPLRQLKVYLTIIDSIKQSGKLPKLSLSKQALGKYLLRLKCEGIIKRIGYATWEVLKEVNFKSIPPKVTKHHLPPRSLKSDFIRAHNIMFKLKVDSPLSWEARLNARGVSFSRLRQGHLKVSFEGFKVWLCKEAVIIYYPSGMDFISPSVPSSLRYAVKGFFALIPRLEAFLGLPLRYNGGLVWSMSRKHLGLVKNALAQEYAAEHKKLKVFDDKGLWLLADDSYSLGVRTQTNETEARVVQAFFNYVKKNPDFYVQFTAMLAGQLVINQQQAGINKQFSDNLQLVKEALERLGGGSFA